MKKSAKKHRRQRKPGAPHAPAPAPVRPAPDAQWLVGQALARWDKPARAIDALDRAIAAQPARTGLRRLRGHLLRRVGRLKPAAADLIEAARLAPDDRALAYEACLVCLAANGAALEPALARLERAAAARLESLLAAQRGDPAMAEAALAGMTHVLDRLLTGVLAVVQGQSARASQLLAEVVGEEALAPAARALAHLYLGAAHVQRRELAPAAAALERARELGAPAVVETYLRWVYHQQAVERALANDLAGTAERFQAVASLGGQEAAEAQRHAAAALAHGGQARARGDDYDGAIAAWTAALQITPQDATVRQHLAVALERAGRTAEAIPHWHELIQSLPRPDGRAGKKKQQPADQSPEEPDLHAHTRAVAHRHLADLYADQDDVGRAIEQLEKAVQLVPDDTEARRSLARMQLDEGRAKAAVHHFQQLVAAAPESAADRTDLGIALLHSGERAAAKEQLARAVALDPHSPIIRLALASALAGDVLVAPGQPDAVRDAQRAVDLSPPAYMSMSLGALGAAQLAHGDVRGAKKTLGQAIKASPSKALVGIRVGHIYWNAGYHAEAVAEWGKAMKQGRKVDCVYAQLVEAWALAGDAARCQESVWGGLARCGPHCVLESVVRVAGSPANRPALPVLREALRAAYDKTNNPDDHLAIVEMLAAAGDVPAARSRLNTLARESVEAGDDELVQKILDLDAVYRLLDRKSTERIMAWLDTALPGGLAAMLPGFEPYQEKGWERWDR